MKPEDVNPQNFKVEKIIYNQDEFSIAIGVWQEDQTKRFAIRWNQMNSSSDKGFPLSSGHPMWFQLPIDVKDFIKIIIENSNPLTLK